MNRIFFFIFFVLIILSGNNTCFSQVVINEIQAAPVNGEPEWLELYNCTGSELTLENVRLEDAVSSKNIGTIRLIGSYTIITKDTTLLKLYRYLPSNAELIQASIPIYNNDYDKLMLRSQDSILIDSVYYNYSWGVRGRSFERIDWSQPAVSKNNLSPSLSPDSATAGYKNSVAKLDYDVGLSNINDGNDFKNSIVVSLQNCGRIKIDKINYVLLIDVDKNRKFTDSELILNDTVENLEAGDTIHFEEHENIIKSFVNRSGNFKFIFYINSDRDINFENDTILGNIYIPYQHGAIQFNEFMYDVDSEMSEFIELWNTSNDTIELNSWYLHDAAAGEPYEYYKINSDSFFIAPLAYSVITWDSTIFIKFPELYGKANVYYKKSSLNLNQGGDAIVITDPLFNVIDSVYYQNSWHNNFLTETKNISLEKFNPSLNSNNRSSWSSCTDERGATPTALNSNFYQIFQSEDISAEPNPFSPYSLGKDNLCNISYKFPFIQSVLSVTIFDINGIIVRKLIASDLVSSSGTLVWDGRNDENYLLPVGPYILFLEAADTASEENQTKKILIAIGKRN